MMFLYYFSLGLVKPIITLYLTGEQYLGFSGTKAGLISGMEALAVILSPLLGAFITDKFISAEKLLAVLQLIAGILLLFFPLFRGFWVVLPLFAFYLILFNPGVALTNAITFHNSNDLGHSFGNVRKWGTIGWIVAGLGFGMVGRFIFKISYSDSFRIAGVVAILLALYSLFVLSEKSHTQEEVKAPKRLFPIEAFKILLKKEILLITLISVVVKLVDKYYYFGCSPFLNNLGAEDQWIPAIMSIGQISEVIVLIFLGKFISRFGFKRILILGVIMEIFRFILLALSSSLWMTLFAFPFHGLAFAFFFSTAFVYIDSYTDSNSRAGVQHLYALITGATGSFLGAIIPGMVMGTVIFSGENGYKFFWIVPGIMAIGALLLTLFLSPTKKTNATKN